jgi:hypothetical protein
VEGLDNSLENQTLGFINLSDKLERPGVDEIRRESKDLKELGARIAIRNMCCGDWFAMTGLQCLRSGNGSRLFTKLDLVREDCEASTIKANPTTIFNSTQPCWICIPALNFYKHRVEHRIDLKVGCIRCDDFKPAQARICYHFQHPTLPTLGGQDRQYIRTLSYRIV